MSQPNQTVPIPKSAFYKIITDREVRHLLVAAVNSNKTGISIENEEGETLIATNGNRESCQPQKYPIEVDHQRVGWAIVPEELAWIASWIAYLSKQELEKQEFSLKAWERQQEINLFQDISTQITSSLEVQEVTHLVLEEAGKFIPCTWGSISLLNSSADRLFTYAQFGEPLSNLSSIEQAENCQWQAIESLQGKIINLRENELKNREHHHALVCLICVPLKVNEKILGSLAIGSEVFVEYTADDLKLMTMFAAQAAVAIEKALLYEQTRNAAAIAQEQTVQLQQALYELKQTQSQLIQREKMSSLGELIAGVAHEINNPVNFINGNLIHAENYVKDLLELIQMYQNTVADTSPEIQEFVANIELDYLIEDLPKLLASMREGVNRICQILLSLRNFSRQDRGQLSLVNIHDCLDSTLLILQHRLKNTATHGGIKILKFYGDFPSIYCYPGQLNQVFINLLGNAIDAIEESVSSDSAKKGKPQICIRTEKINDHRVQIRIADSGIGMSDEVRSQLFNTFFTTKPLGKGTGLGLSICYQIITQKHGGSLQCLSEPGEGTEFMIELPIRSA